jgi:hypothetical protein
MGALCVTEPYRSLKVPLTTSHYEGAQQKADMAAMLLQDLGVSHHNGKHVYAWPLFMSESISGFFREFPQISYKEQPINYTAFWDVTPCGCCKNRRFRGTCRLHHQFLITALSRWLFTLVMKAIRSSETQLLRRGRRRNIPEDFLHSCHCEHVKSCISSQCASVASYC